MASFLDTALLASHVRQRRGRRTLRAVSLEIGGISASTLSRVENGKSLEIDAFLKICDWLDESPTLFISKTDQVIVTRSENNIDMVFFSHLEIFLVEIKRDPNLNAAAAEAITVATIAMYVALSQKHSRVGV